MIKRVEVFSAYFDTFGTLHVDHATARETDRLYVFDAGARLKGFFYRTQVRKSAKAFTTSEESALRVLESGIQTDLARARVAVAQLEEKSLKLWARINRTEPAPTLLR